MSIPAKRWRAGREAEKPEINGSGEPEQLFQLAHIAPADRDPEPVLVIHNQIALLVFLFECLGVLHIDYVASMNADIMP